MGTLTEVGALSATTVRCIQAIGYNCDISCVRFHLKQIQHEKYLTWDNNKRELDCCLANKSSFFRSCSNSCKRNLDQVLSAHTVQYMDILLMSVLKLLILMVNL